MHLHCNAYATFILLAAIAPAVRAADPETMSWNVNGVERQAIIDAPSAEQKSGGAPLVFVFHGHGGNMHNISRTMHIQTVWPEAIVVYPQGIPTPTRIDPAGKKDGWQRSPGEVGDRDLKFFDAMLATIRKKYEVDDDRVYATGFSNGGVFTFLLWGERPNLFAAFAPCAGPPSKGVNLSVPKPVFIVAGKQDEVVPAAERDKSIERSRALDGATGAGDSQGGDVVLYKSTKGAPVQTMLHPGGHVLPRKAPQLIVEFFQAHELKK